MTHPVFGMAEVLRTDDCGTGFPVGHERSERQWWGDAAQTYVHSECIVVTVGNQVRTSLLRASHVSRKGLP